MDAITSSNDGIGADWRRSPKRSLAWIMECFTLAALQEQHVRLTRFGAGFFASQAGLSHCNSHFGLGQVVGFFAFPVTFGLFAHWCAHWFRSNTRSTAVSRRADSFTFRAVFLLAHILGATDIALWFVAVNFAFSTSSLFALNLAFWSFADWVAFGRADGIVALPSALWVTIFFHLQEGALSLHSNSE